MYGPGGYWPLCLLYAKQAFYRWTTGPLKSVWNICNLLRVYPSTKTFVTRVTYFCPCAYRHLFHTEMGITRIALVTFVLETNILLLNYTPDSRGRIWTGVLLVMSQTGVSFNPCSPTLLLIGIYWSLWTKYTIPVWTYHFQPDQTLWAVMCIKFLWIFSARFAVKTFIHSWLHWIPHHLVGLYLILLNIKP